MQIKWDIRLVNVVSMERDLHKGTSRGGIYVLHNGTVKTTQTRGGVNVWTGSGDVAVIYKDRREVGKHLFEVTGSVQEGYDF